MSKTKNKPGIHLMSNEPTIEQMNEAIALFDGWEAINGKYASLYKKDGKVYALGDFKYHSSWDWLHSVWDKFRALDFINHPLVLYYQIHLDRIAEYMAYRTISETHYTLHRAIQWYNRQKEANNETH